MICRSFFFSYQALSIGIGRDGIGLKVTEIAQTDRQTHIARLIYKDMHLRITKNSLCAKKKF